MWFRIVLIKTDKNKKKGVDMDISRLGMAAALFPFASITQRCEQFLGGLISTQQARLPAVTDAPDMRDVSSPVTQMANISPTSFLPEVSAASADGWEKTRDEDGIRIFARTDPGKSFQRLRGEFQIKGTKQVALNALMDPEHFIDWLDGMQKITVSDRTENDQAFTLHAVSKEANLLVTTIPAREISLRCERKDSPKDGSTQLTMKMLPPPKETSKNRIYADAFDGEVSLTPKGKGEIEMSFSCYFEPGGSLPAWAINRVSAGSVYKSMNNARNRIFNEQGK